jgi:hypothetical protein
VSQRLQAPDIGKLADSKIVASLALVIDAYKVRFRQRTVVIITRVSVE